MAFLEDPRLRQRWNQITHEAENVTENAAAGIWSFKEFYINPCLGYATDSFEQCTTVCLGDPEERLRRRRERDRARAEYSFDFYDDWYDDEQDGSNSFFGGWGGDDWDRLLAGTGSQRRRPGAETTEQPRRKRGMSYGTRGSRRKVSENDPTVIPSTQPIGFLTKLPWKMGGTLRYKPSAADLQDHPGKADAENPEREPLLVSDDESDYGAIIMPRKRSGTTGSGDTSDSYRSRGDLFSSDVEGEEDAVALDDDITYDMVRKGSRSRARSDMTRSSNQTRSSKGKRPANKFSGSRTVSKSTLNSTSSHESLDVRQVSLSSQPVTPALEDVPSLKDLQLEEERLQEEEDEEVARKKEAAAQLASERGLELRRNNFEPKPVVTEDEQFPLSKASSTEQFPLLKVADDDIVDHKKRSDIASNKSVEDFVPARLPHFG